MDASGKFEMFGGCGIGIVLVYRFGLTMALADDTTRNSRTPSFEARGLLPDYGPLRLFQLLFP
jgi:hypothetical protein